MRLRLTLHPLKANCSVPLSYNYYLSTAIYKWIEQSSPSYARFLHDHGYQFEGTVRRFKHFCFSQLIIQKRKLLGDRLQIVSPSIQWYISMPVETSLLHLVVGMFERRQFYIEQEGDIFAVDCVETVPEPAWRREMKFRLLSPLTVSIPEERNGRLMPHYIRPHEEVLGETLRKNILHKYMTLHDREPDDLEFACTPDWKFIADRGGPDKISKLITIKEGQNGETKVRGFMCPVTITGNLDLLKLAYDSGLGEKGSMGFGMLETIQQSF